MLDSLHWCAKKESNKHAPGRVVIYISVHLVSIYTLTFSNVLLVLALNLIVHKSSYCKCSLAWCQARTFLLFTIWTNPLQMREYPLQYASTDKNKKSHYKRKPLLYIGGTCPFHTMCQGFFLGPPSRENFVNPPIWQLSPFLDQGLSPPPPSRGSYPKIWKI